MPTLSPKRAIAAFCRFCLYDPKGGCGTALEQIRACTARDCPLWLHRPGAARVPRPRTAAQLAAQAAGRERLVSMRQAARGASAAAP